VAVIVIDSSGQDVVLGDIAVGHVVDAFATHDGIGAVTAAHEVVTATPDQVLLATIERPESHVAGEGVVTCAAQQVVAAAKAEP
jgi:hypothetical protein